ncbi:MAG: saccharopine dehydrogenase NADP-binding domain-containing protein [Chloroflexi bacterium]|nr:saccharopine dehydrogenase NADP-binding domain-containing protein [Chloroflexota bacterium]
MKFAVLGSGMMANALIHDLVQNPETELVYACDIDLERAKAMAARFPKVEAEEVDVSNRESLIPILKSVDTALGFASYHYNFEISKAAIETGTNYVDLGGNNTIVEKQFTLHDAAKEAGVAIFPDCGLAPGMVSILAAGGYNRLESVDSIKLRVGGLPQDRDISPIGYSLFFSVKGLVNEYIEPVTILKNGKKEIVEPLSELEEIEFPEPYGKLEAATTSGGTSTLPDTYEGKVPSLDYKTIRYPGHFGFIKKLYDLGFFSEKEVRMGDRVYNEKELAERGVLGLSGFKLPGRKYSAREITESLFVSLLPHNAKDVVLLRVEVSGRKDGNTASVTYEMIEKYDEENDLSAMMKTTSFPASIIAQMITDGTIKEKGVLKQELYVPAELFLKKMREKGINISESVV